LEQAKEVGPTPCPATPLSDIACFDHVPDDDACSGFLNPTELLVHSPLARP
jgi:hypothetical protein